MSPRDLRRWLPRLGLAYVVAGLLAATQPGFEVFPFFSWFLFPVVPGDDPRYELVVETLEGVPVTPPRDIQALGYIDDPKAMDLWVTTQRLGRSLETGSATAALAVRRIVEGSFLCGDTRYAVEKVWFDPLERWETGAVRARTRIARFESRADCARSPWVPARRGWREAEP